MEGAFKYVTLNLMSSALFLAAVGILYGVAGTLNMADLAVRLNDVAVRGPTLPDRVVALDLLTILAVAIITLYALATNERILLDTAIVLALISFLGTVAFARYVERRSRND